MLSRLKITGYILLCLCSLSSCFNWRYTSFGRPFDFLHAKHQGFSPKGTVQDSLPPTEMKLSEESDWMVQKDTSNVSNKDQAVEFMEGEEKSVLLNVNPEEQVTHAERDQVGGSLIKGSQPPRFIKKMVVQKGHFSSAGERAQDPRPWPDWWYNMWEAIWKFFLKWLLIALAVFIVLVAVLFGIYYLILWIGGVWAAAIVLFLLILALLVFCDIDLFWIFNLL